MRITCYNFNDALRIIANVEKSTAGHTNPADQLEIGFADTGHRIVVDYTDSEHRVISIFGLNFQYDTARIWKDTEINMDSIASALFSDYCDSICSVFDYINNSLFSVRNYEVELKQSGTMSIEIDTSERWSDEEMDSLCAGYIHAKVTIAYTDKDEREDLLATIKKWREQHAYNLPFTISES